MSFWMIVDVFIGLTLCYLLLGLIGTSLQEALAGWLNWRGKCLRQGLQSLLAHSAAGDKNADWLFARITGHSLVQPAIGGRAPTYISAANFGTALVDGLLDGSQAPLFSQIESTVAALPAGPVKQSLTALLVRAGGDLDSFHASVERWFDDAMDRVSGVYKRLAQNYMLIFGVAVAVLGNVDSIEMARRLQNDPAVLQQAIEAATSVSPPAAPSSATDVGQTAALSSGAALANAQASAAKLAGLNLPMGWTADKFRALTNPLALVVKLFGLLITALAVSLGAPFWFDTLQLFLNIRTAGPKPSRADDKDATESSS